jgi:ribosomal protein L19
MSRLVLKRTVNSQFLYFAPQIEQILFKKMETIRKNYHVVELLFDSIVFVILGPNY